MIPVFFDLLSLVFLAAIFLVIKQVRDNWSSLWDDDLTPQDRSILQRAAFVLGMPAIVFFHELGHAFAIRLFGGTVLEFHYTPLWGYVVPHGLYDPQQMTWAYIAGNLVQVLIGLAALAVAFVARRPPLVALAAYVGLWALGGTLVVYALMSVSGLYGDWIAIYTSPVTPLVVAVAVVHASLVALLVFCLYGEHARFWFVSKTDVVWQAQFKSALDAQEKHPSAGGLAHLSALLFSVNLPKMAGNYWQKARQVDANDPLVRLFEADLAVSNKQYSQAESLYCNVAAREDAWPITRAMALIAVADLRMTAGDDQGALAAVDQAILLVPNCADPHFKKGVVLSKMRNFEAALVEFFCCRNLVFFNRRFALALKEQTEQARRSLFRSP